MSLASRIASSSSSNGDDDEHRPEHLVAPDLGVERHVGDQGRLVVAAAGEVAGGRAAAGDDLGVVAGALDHAGDLGLVGGAS